MKRVRNVVLWLGGGSDRVPALRLREWVESVGLRWVRVPDARRMTAEPDTVWFAACRGMTGSMASVRDGLRQLGVPTLVMDLGYFDRARDSRDTEGFYQCGWNKIGWLPSGRVSEDRWRALNLEIWSKLRRPEGLRRVLVLGQVPHDTQHQLDEEGLRRRLWRLCGGALRQLAPDAVRVVLRPHPLRLDLWDEENPGVCGEAEVVREDPLAVNLAESLGASDVVVTVNSTAGLEALRMGVDVVSCPSAFYWPWCGPDGDDRADLFARVAYAQWRPEEIADGRMMRWMLKERPVRGF